MRIAVDIDDTLNTLDKTGRASSYIARMGLPFKLQDPYTHSIIKAFDWTEQDCIAFLQAGGIVVFTDAEAKPYAREVLTRWREEGHEIVILTTRRKEWFSNPDVFSRDWLEKRKIPYDELVTGCDDKGAYCAEHGISVLIDDKVSHAQSAVERGVRALLLVDKSNLKESVSFPLSAATWKQVEKRMEGVFRVEAFKSAMLVRPAEESKLGAFTVRSLGVDETLGNCVVPSPCLDLEAQVEMVEEAGKTRFLLTADDKKLDKLLSAKGYGVEQNWELLARPLGVDETGTGEIVFGKEGEELYSEVTGCAPTGADFYAVAFEGLRPVSVCSGRMVEDKLYLGDIYTQESARYQGHATNVLKTAMEEGRKRGASEAFLRVRTVNASAKRLYEFMGFERVFGFWFRKKNG